MLHAVMAVSGIARGRVAPLDVAAATGASGRRRGDDPGEPPGPRQDPDAQDNPFMFRLDLLQNDGVRYANQPIAVVIAETLEAATEGAALLRPRYETRDRPASSSTPASASRRRGGRASAIRRAPGHGDVEAGLAAADAPRRGHLRDAGAVPQRHGAPRESWRRGTATGSPLDTPSQGLAMAQGRLAGPVRDPAGEHPHPQPLPRRRLRLEGLHLRRRRSSGILAAKLVGRPVKLVLRREQMYGPVGHRAPTRQTLRARRGRGRRADRARPPHPHDAHQHLRRLLRAGLRRLAHASTPRPAIATSHEAVRLDTGTPLFMRAPGEATGSIALESAIDEMAEACGIDPLAFRLKNYAEVGADHRQAVLLEGPARVLRAGRRALRLGARARSRRGRCATRTGCWSAGASAPRPSRR